MKSFGYKDEGWKSLGDWLGTDTIATQLRQYLPFEEARKYVRSLGLQTQGEWKEYCNSGRKPEDIPSAPNLAYQRNGWINFGDWLGTGNVATHLRVYLPFEQARIFVHDLHLKNQAGWKDYCKSGEKPDNIPSNPNITYKNEGWRGYGDWVGNRRILNKFREYLPFSQAKEIVHRLQLKNTKEWRDYCESNDIENIPAYPDQVYKNSGWISWGDWLGTGYISHHLRNFLPYEQAKEFIHSLRLSSYSYWLEYCKSGDKPESIPFNPQRTYRGRGWVGYGDWLGTHNITSTKRVFDSFEDARLFVRSLRLRNQEEWNAYCKSGNKPNQIPSAPWVTYKEKGWQGIRDWLGY